MVFRHLSGINVHDISPQCDKRIDVKQQKKANQ